MHVQVHIHGYLYVHTYLEMRILCRAWQRWLQWREAYLEGSVEEDKCPDGVKSLWLSGAGGHRTDRSNFLLVRGVMDLQSG